MTDEQINRAVAEARGYKNEGHSDDFGEMWTDVHGRSAFLPLVCSDPAAWAELFIWLKEQGLQPVLEGYENFGYTAEVGDDPRTPMNDPLPGRVLALAFLKAVQP